MCAKYKIMKVIWILFGVIVLISIHIKVELSIAIMFIGLSIHSFIIKNSSGKREDALLIKYFNILFIAMIVLFPFILYFNIQNILYVYLSVITLICLAYLYMLYKYDWHGHLFTGETSD